MQITKNFFTMKTKKILNRGVFVTLILFLLSFLSMKAQNWKTEGMVTDSNGEPMIGVSVLVKGTNQGTVTNVDGKYFINISDVSNPVLILSYIGYSPIELKITSASQVNNIVMQSNDKILDEVVVVGYGTQKKANLTGAVSSIKVDDIKNIPVSNTASLLQGRMSGVTVSTFSAQPGNDTDVEIKIRGIGTFGNSNPLILIDGVEGSLSSVSPNDIENISVLKDASSAAIYGVRAANGVVLVTTKKGTTDKMKVSYNGNYGVQQATVLPDYVNSWQWATLYNEQETAMNTTNSLYTDEMLEKLKNGSDPYHFANTKWSDELFRTAKIQNHYLSMTGGGVNSNYLASINYLNQDGIMLGTKSDRASYRLNAESKYNKLTVGLYTTGTYQKVTEPSIGTYSVFEQMRWHSRPTVPVKYENGKWGYFDGNSTMQIIKNPIHSASIPSNKIINRFDGKIYLDFEVIKNLHIKSSFAYQSNNWRASSFGPTYISTDAEGNAKGIGYTKNTLDEQYYYGSQWVNENYATYSIRIDDHSINALIGQSNQYNGYRLSYSHGEYFPSNNVQVLNAALSSNAKGTAEEATLRSLFGRLNYNYKDRYLAEFNLRKDQTSRFSKENRTGYFPSASIGWILSEENFLKNMKELSALKLRASWGQLGNQDIGYYPYTQYIKMGSNYVWGNSIVSGSAIQTLANPDIKWEVTSTSDIGIDLSMLKSRVTFSADFYVKNSSDILLQLPISDILGADDAPYVNAASVKNTGWDVELGYNDKWKDWSFGAKINVSGVKNEITDLKGKQSWINGWTINLEGNPINSYYGYKADGLYRTQEEVDIANDPAGEAYNLIGGGNLKIGDIKLVNTNDDKVIDDKDRTILGNPFPKLSYSLNLNAGYKGFDLSAFFQGIGGINRVIMDWPTVSGNVTTAMWDRYSDTNPTGSFPRLGNGAYNAETSSFWIKDASYLRLKNLELGYSIDSKYLSKIKLQHIRVYISAQNVLTFTKIKDYDPEKYGDDTRGYAFPNAKTYSVGLNVTL
ncbi:MAG: TonB dependent receptor [Bacteroidetes bacterium]|nr:TonB dependent receptor [Bacteroidota bacterium]